MKMILLLLITFITMISCGETTSTTSISDLNKDDIIGTWGMYKMAMDTGNGELSTVIPEMDSDSIVPSIKFTADSIYLFSPITDEIIVKSYVFDDNSVTYDHPKIEGQKKTLYIDFEGDNLVLKSSNIEMTSITIFMYCKRLE